MDIENAIEIDVDTSTSAEAETELEKAGPAGLSAYEVAVKNGFVGTEQEWLDSLVGPEGPEGQEGSTGPAGRDGAIQYTAGNHINIENNVISADLTGYATENYVNEIVGNIATILATLTTVGGGE